MKSYLVAHASAQKIVETVTFIANRLLIQHKS